MSTAAAGLLVGSWELQEPIGNGGQATVHRARHATLGRFAAVKLIRRSVWADPAFRVRFRRECDALAALDHAHVIPVLDAGECDGRGYLAMRLARGGSLAERLRDGALAPHDALPLLEAIARAVDAVHAAGRVHRDVTPANILLDPDAGPWLGDFGLARRIDATIATQEGTLVGTAGYLAPEVIAGGRAGPEADRYALAAVAYHALTGRAPFAAHDLAGVLYAHMHLSPPPVREAQPHLPHALDRALGTGLARQPAARPATAAALMEGVRAALQGAPVHDPVRRTASARTATRMLPPPAPPAWPDAATAAVDTRPGGPRRRRRTVTAVVAGATALAVGFGGGLAYTQRDALPFLAPAAVEPVRVTTVPGADGIDVPAAPATADDLPDGVAATDAVAATVGDVHVASLPGGAAALADVRAALADRGYRESAFEYQGRAVGIDMSLPWAFMTGADHHALLVLREPAGERALVVRGRGGDVERYVEGLAVAIGARILPTS